MSAHEFLICLFKPATYWFFTIRFPLIVDS
uniref:Uncharacterized protein n=1 Tax=Rhizophora mucronata TaxID=61149 RepID=A0A2P2PUP1_RHIMU